MDALSFGEYGNDTEQEEEYTLLISGGISGAITNPESTEAVKHANMLYEAIRRSKTDVKRISQNTGYDIEFINKVKHYLFLDKHELIDGYRRFDADFSIAQSWYRLAFHLKEIERHDLLLLKHEEVEMEYMSQGYTQNEAHLLTCRDGYDYKKASNEYYNQKK